MKKLTILLVSFVTAFSFLFGFNVLDVSAQENQYVSYEPVSDERMAELLDEYDSVKIYSRARSGTHSVTRRVYDKTFPYSRIGYHPDTPRWTSATGYSVSKTKSRSFSISVSASNVTKTASISIGAASTSSETFTYQFGLTDSEINQVRNQGKLTRLGVYAKVQKQMFEADIYDNVTGQRLSTTTYPHVTTWDKAGNKGEVSYYINLN